METFVEEETALAYGGAECEAASCSQAEQAQPLTGERLLDFYDTKAAAGMSHKDIAYRAGYFGVTKTGIERVNSRQFNEALLAAKGVPVSAKRTSGGRGNAGLSRARVSGAGILLVSQLAVRQVGGAPGSIFQVDYPAEGQILLTDTGKVTPINRRKSEADESA